ncbi:MAG: endonuclease VIII, partial [Anaerolineales bacterium]
MIELPEAVVIAQQITETLGGKRIARAVANASPHKFAWYTGDPAEYNEKLAGKVIGKGAGVAMNIEIEAGDMMLAISAPIHFYTVAEKRPKKHQLLLEFEDGTAISSSAQMWGGFFCFPAGEKGGYYDYENAKTRPSPLSDAFDRAYFDTLFDENTPKLSAKAFLATEQHIPGLGNGVLQDILWTA